MTRDAASEDNRLRWKCRRGMLELDLVLQAFLRNGLAQLDGSGRLAFEQLLEYPDQVLQGWLIGGVVPMDRDIGHVVRQIRASVTH